MEALIFIGIQGSGKTTFYREHFLDTHVRISLDQLKTRDRERIFLETCLRTGQRFVIDNTNIKIADRARYIAAARRARFRVKGYFFETTVRDALRRNAQRSGKAVIPAAGVVGAFKRLERPALSEGFDELYLVSRDCHDGPRITGCEESVQPDTPKTADTDEVVTARNNEVMITGLTPGLYANRSGEYEVLADGSVWLIGGQDLPEGADRVRVDSLPSDAAMTPAAMEKPLRSDG